MKAMALLLFIFAAFALHRVAESSNAIPVMERRNIDLMNTYYSDISVNITPARYRFVMVQAVSQLKNISVSYDKKLKYGSHLNATSVGVIYMLNGGETIIRSYLASPHGPTTAQVMIIAFNWKDPIPGGCCITCAFDNDPNIYVKRESLATRLHFGRGNVHFDPGKKPEVCDGGEFATFRHLEHDLYFYHLKENDFTEEGLFEASWKMSAPSSIKKYGKKVATIKRGQGPMFVLQSLPYQGVVYNILLRDTKWKTESSYMPTFLYGCDINDKSTCSSFGSVTTIIYTVLYGIIGLALCFFGHRFLAAEIFFSGLIAGSLVSYILILRFASLEYTAHILASTAAGFVLGITLLLLYLETTLFIPFFLLEALLIGFLVACSVLFSPLSEMKTFSNNTIFLLVFVSIMLACPIFLLFFLRITSIIFSSLIGGYIVVVDSTNSLILLSVSYIEDACSIFIDANIQYIVIEFVLRTGIPSFADAYLRVPFQQNEFILCGAWGILLLTGSLFQHFFTKGRPFPPLSKKGRRTKGCSIFCWPTRMRGTIPRNSDERTPLLQNESTQQGYGTSRKHSVNVV